eukprot:scaffold378700_cov38-Prasinocladus_malaysianus.AAC.1
MSPNTCNLKILYANQFIKPANSMLKGVINSGVDSGVKKNFAVLKELLSEMVEVRDNLAADSPADSMPAAASGQPHAQAQATPTRATLPGPMGWLAGLESRLLDSAGRLTFGRQLVQKLPVKQDHFTAVLSLGLVAAILWVALAAKSLLVAPLADFCQWSAASLLRLLPSTAPSSPPPEAPPSEQSDEVVASAEAQAQPAEEAQAEGGPTMKSEVQKQFTKLRDLSSSLVRDIASTSSDSIASVQRSIAHARAGQHPSQAPGTSLPTKLPPAAPVHPSKGSATSSNPPIRASQGSRGSSAAPSPRISPRVTSEDVPDSSPAPFAEVFENERYQPIRGWGHTWPGHLMPGDFSRWSLADDFTSSMVFSEVRPSLPEKYKWIDSEWQVDLSGLPDEAMDEEGWAYAMHWKWITHPPQPGMGKKKFGSTVRQRRHRHAYALHQMLATNLS